MIKRFQLELHFTNTMNKTTLKNIFLFAAVCTIMSCGKDVVEIDSPTIPSDVDNVFEVNLVGLPHDNNGVYIPEANFTINGIDAFGDETGFFHDEKQLIGNKGAVVKAVKEGYLPTYKRVYHHNTLEDVIVDIAMIEEPSPQVVGTGGIEFKDENNTNVIIDEGDLVVNSELIYYTDIIGDDRVTYIDNLLDDDSIQLLDINMLLYIDCDNLIATDQSITIEISDSDLGSTPQGVDLFFYDEAINSWIARSSIMKTTNKVTIEVDRFGWWALGSARDAKYGTLELDQLGQPVSSYRTELSMSGVDDQNPEILYTSKLGTISKYWPIDESVELSFVNSAAELNVSFSGNDQSLSKSLSEEVNIKLDGHVLSCDLDLHTGYVAVLSEGQHTIIPIENGAFVGYTSTLDETVQLNFYNDNYESKTIQSVDVTDWQSIKASFVACDKTLSVKDNSTVTLADFEKCRIKVNPYESLVIGEQEGLGIFMASFSGDQVGIYTGLLFSTAESFEGGDINSSAELNILVYDEVSKTVAGKIDGVFISGEPFNISFIGNIE